MSVKAFTRSLPLLCVAALGLSSCGAEAAADPLPFPEHVEVRTDLPTVGHAWAATLPLSFSADQNERLYTLWQTETAGCMQERGFDYAPIVYPPEADLADLVNPLDRDFAAVMGYHELLVLPHNTNVMDETVYAALDGTESAPGCAAVGWDASFGAIEDITNQIDLARNSFAGAIVGFESSDTGRDVAETWSDCMDDAGHGFDTPQDAWIAYVEEPTITATEIEVRLADLDCDIESGLTQARHEWEQAQVNSWLADNESLVRELTEAKLAFAEQLESLEAATSRS